MYVCVKYVKYVVKFTSPGKARGGKTTQQYRCRRTWLQSFTFEALKEGVCQDGSEDYQLSKSTVMWVAGFWESIFRCFNMIHQCPNWLLVDYSVKWGTRELNPAPGPVLIFPLDLGQSSWCPLCLCLIKTTRIHTSSWVGTSLSAGSRLGLQESREREVGPQMRSLPNAACFLYFSFKDILDF